MVRILVTGGCGYIGSHTIVDLLSHGYEVVSIDNFSRSNPLIFEGIRKITGKNVLNLELDLADFEAVKCISGPLKNIDGIIHFAAYKSVGESVDHPLMYYRNNIQSLVNLLDIAADNDIANFVFSSSCTVYGDADALPVTESTPLGKIQSPYGMTKLIGEQLIQDYVKASKNMNAILLRYFNPVGAHPSADIGELPIDIPNNLIPIITQTAAGLRKKVTVFGNDYSTKDGSCIRDYIHVMDVASAHTRALEYMMSADSDSSCEVFNLGAGEGLSVLEIVEAFQRVNGIDLNYEIGPRRQGDVEAIYADNTKAREALKWDVKYGIEDMMRTSWEWQKRLKSIIHS